IVRSKQNHKIFLDTTQNLNGKINRTKFQLDHGSHPYLELQQEWNEHGSEASVIEVLDTLKYDKDESKTDYSEELEILRMVWEERLIGEGLEFYKKKG